MRAGRRPRGRRSPSASTAAAARCTRSVRAGRARGSTSACAASIRTRRSAGRPWLRRTTRISCSLLFRAGTRSMRTGSGRKRLRPGSRRAREAIRERRPLLLPRVVGEHAELQAMRWRLRRLGRLDGLHPAPSGESLMVRARAIVAALLALGLALVGSVSAGGGRSAAASRSFDPLYSAGDRVDGLPLAAVLRRDDAAEFVSFVYGDCVAGDDAGCAPPAEIQVWPACRRNLGAVRRRNRSRCSRGADQPARRARAPLRRRNEARARDRSLDSGRLRGHP